MSIRQAALVVHGLAPEDRVWMLAQLDAAQRLRLEPLLRELEALGVPAAPDLLAQALSGVEADAFQPMKEQVVSPFDQLMALSADTVIDILRREPQALIERLLAARPWPWAAAVVTAFSLPEPSHAPQERQPAALLERVAQRLMEAAQVKASSVEAAAGESGPAPEDPSVMIATLPSSGRRAAA